MTSTSQGLHSAKQVASQGIAFIKRILFAAVCTISTLSVHSIPTEAALLVGNTSGNNVVQYGLDGSFLGEFIPSNPALNGGLTSPDDLVYGPGGDLFISSGSNSTGQILRFDGLSGQFKGVFSTFAPGDSPGLLKRPYGMAFGPDGNLYVSSFLQDRILRFNATTGLFVDVFATGNGAPGGLNGPNDLLFTPDGRLLVSTQGSVAVPGDGNSNGIVEPGEFRADFGAALPSQILSYDIGTGAASVLVDQPTPLLESFRFVSFLGLAIGPNGDLFTTDFANGIRVFDINNGALKSVISTNYTGTIPSNNFIGNLTFVGDTLYTVGFNFTQNNQGAILRYDGLTGDPLPSAGNPAAVFVATNSNLSRPIGITQIIPTPALLPGLMGMGIAALRKRRAEREAALE
jgi:sugar lactone lactonase YvrE